MTITLELKSFQPELRRFRLERRQIRPEAGRFRLNAKQGALEKRFFGLEAPWFPPELKPFQPEARLLFLELKPRRREWKPLRRGAGQFPREKPSAYFNAPAAALARFKTVFGNMPSQNIPAMQMAIEIFAAPESGIGDKSVASLLQ